MFAASLQANHLASHSLRRNNALCVPMNANRRRNKPGKPRPMAPQSKHHQPDPAAPAHKDSARPSEPAVPTPARSKPKKQQPGPTTTNHNSASGKRSSSTKASKTEITPSMAQFLEIKAANPDSVLWYRMGDFYELFFDDAVVVSKALSIKTPVKLPPF